MLMSDAYNQTFVKKKEPEKRKIRIRTCKVKSTNDSLPITLGLPVRAVRSETPNKKFLRYLNDNRT